MSPYVRLLSVVAACIPLACGAATAPEESEPAKGDVFRSPSLDYGPAAEKRVPAAGDMPVEERLEGSAAVTSDGPKLAPGWSVEDGEVQHSPEEQVGGHVALPDSSPDASRIRQDAGARRSTDAEPDGDEADDE